MVPINQDDEDFKALLKPIQDITRNWNIDLALHLEEYMNYIRQLSGNDIPDMNFAEAAVLVQNSATIYSKKVDFLFTTVCQLLDVVSKKQSEAKSRNNPEDGEGAVEQPAGRRRKPAAVLDTEEFVTFDEVCSVRNLAVNLEKEKQKNNDRRKEKIVLNAAIKVKAKENTSCNVYCSGYEILGKKDEFRLNWRICSAGTLHEEFVINKNRFKTLEPVDISVHENDCPPFDDSHHDYDANHSHHNGHEHLHLPEGDPLPHLSTSLFSTVPVTRESEDNRLKEERVRLEPENIVDINECLWKPIDFNDNISVKPIKKRKVSKIALNQDDEFKRKRLPGNTDGTMLSFTVTDVLFDQFKKISLFRELDFGFQSKCAAKEKRQMLLRHRAKYQEMMEKEAGVEQIDDFHGFYIEENDSDNDLDFEGFGDENNHDYAPDIDVPLPDKEAILDRLKDDGWKADDLKGYDNEAMKTLQEYRARKNEAAASKGVADRVKEWHERIMPKLEAAEHRSSFDIHAYGTKVLDSFTEGIDSSKTFHEVVAGEKREEVARYFLASLMLANQNNVEITRSEPGDLQVNCMQLKLISMVRHHEELDDNIKQTSDK